MSARDNLINEYMFSGWENDKSKSLQFVDFIDHLENKEQISWVTAELIKSGVVDTLVEKEKYGWIDLKWVDTVLHRLLAKYTEKEVEALIYTVKEKGKYEEDYEYVNIKRSLKEIRL